MPATDFLLALVSFAFVSSLTPGPNNLMLMASGTNFGFVRTLPHMLGVAIGFTLMIVLVGLGLAQIFIQYPVAKDFLKWISVLYLLWLAWKLANAAPPSEVPEGASAPKPMTFLQACAFQWVNPKAWTMALTAVTAYALPGDPLVGLAVVAVVFGLVNLPVVSLWALMGAQLRQWLDQPSILRLFNRVMALLLVASLLPVVIPG